MNKTIIIRKDFSNVELRNIFIKVQDGSNSVKDELSSLISNANEKVCYVCEDRANSEVLAMFNNSPARKYIVTSKIEEAKHSSIKDTLIAREVADIKGHYVIIDNTAVVFIDDNLNGVVVKGNEKVEKVLSIFIKEFWDNAKFEYIQEKKPAAETTFDIPPIYSENGVIVDEAFGDVISNLLNNSGVYSYFSKIDSKFSNAQLIIKSIKDNKAFLETTNNEKILYVPSLTTSAISVAEKQYIFNFDIAEYDRLPERKSNRLFAVETEEIKLGKTYRFNKKMQYADLVGKEILTTDEANISIVINDSVQKSVAVDLKMQDYILECDEEGQETQLEKLQSKMFEYNGYACNIDFIIDLILKKKSFTHQAKIYGEYEKAKTSCEHAKSQLVRYCEETKNKKLKRKIEELSAAFSTKEEYEKIRELLKGYISEANNYDDGEVDSDIEAVSKSNKKKKQAPQINITIPTGDLPKYGDLYEQSNRFEYVLNDENNLQLAIKEMSGKQIEFFLE